MKLKVANEQHGYEIGVEGYLTPQEVADYLRLSRRSIDSLAAGGQIRRIKMNRKTVRYCARSVREYAAQFEV